MLDKAFNSIFENAAVTSNVTFGKFMICMAFALVLGFLIALGYMFGNSYSKSLVIALSLLPAIVQVIIMLVNGNLGMAVAITGAFTLVRFRSAPGGAKEISHIFLSMAVGLATGIGYIWVALILTVIVEGVNVIYTLSGFGESKKTARILRVTIPESLDYTTVFDGIFAKYTSKSRLVKVKTSNMGSLYQLNYEIELKKEKEEKQMIDDIRCKNGNLDIVCSRAETSKDDTL